MRYAFEIKTLIMVEADSEVEAWDMVRGTARDAVCDFDFERSPEDDDDDDEDDDDEDDDDEDWED